MNLFRVTNTDNLAKITPSSEQKLRPGQLIQGLVTKLFPENKAEIQLGGQRLIANLEVGLQAGGKYHFQVQSTSEFIQLKVLGEALQGKGEVDIARLLEQLGLKHSKSNINLLQALTRLKIPFDKQQLSQAIHLLKNEKDKPAATKVLIEMIARRLPIKNSIFQAVTVTNNGSISEQLKAVVQQMQQTDVTSKVLQTQQPIQNIQTEQGKPMSIPPLTAQPDEVTRANSVKLMEENLAKAITALTDKPMPFKAGLVQEIVGKNPSYSQAIYRTFQGLGLVELDVDFPRWVAEWTSYSQKENITATSTQFNQKSSVPLPLQINEQEVIQILTKINEERSAFHKAISNFLSQWNKQLHFHSLIKASMTKEDFSALQTDVKKEILPFFQESNRAVFNQLVNTPESIGAFHVAQKAVADGGELSKLIQLLQKSTSDERFIALDPKQQFLQQQKLLVSTLGLDYENQLISSNEPSKQTETIKGMLLQLLAASSEAATPEANTRLLNFINGMQLQSVNETSTILQANIQIPAEKLGLVKDLELEFEGKKTENGEINPDYCRIIFYLELGNLKETIIDLNIQQRAIAVTVFNNNKTIKSIATLFKKKLEENLEAMNYKLSSLVYKNIEDKEKTKLKSETPFTDSTRQGVDYRI